MQEIIDIYDSKKGINIKKTISKDEAHQKGIWHSSVHILLVNKEHTKILLQKRCMKKKFFPNMWDITVGGHIKAGEMPDDGAKREFNEELGLDFQNYEFKYLTKIKEEFLDNNINSKEIVFVYLVEANVNVNDIILLQEEVSEVKWFSKEELINLIETKKIINHLEEFKILLEILN